MKIGTSLSAVRLERIGISETNVKSRGHHCVNMLRIFNACLDEVLLIVEPLAPAPGCARLVQPGPTYVSIMKEKQGPEQTWRIRNTFQSRIFGIPCRGTRTRVVCSSCISPDQPQPVISPRHRSRFGFDVEVRRDVIYSSKIHEALIHLLTIYITHSESHHLLKFPPRKPNSREKNGN